MIVPGSRCAAACSRSPSVSPPPSAPPKPERSRLSVVPLPVAVGADVAVVLVADAGLAQVLGVVASGVVLRVLHARHAAVAEEVANGW